MCPVDVPYDLGDVQYVSGPNLEQFVLTPNSWRTGVTNLGPRGKSKH